MRLIDETAYQIKIAKIPMKERTFLKAWETAQHMPTIDAVPVVRGEWKNVYKSGHKPNPENVCSECDCWSHRRSNYCPNCGAKMEDKPCG